MALLIVKRPLSGFGVRFVQPPAQPKQLVLLKHTTPSKHTMPAFAAADSVFWLLQVAEKSVITKTSINGGNAVNDERGSGRDGLVAIPAGPFFIFKRVLTFCCQKNTF